MAQVTPPPQNKPAGFNPAFEVNAKRTRLSFDDVHAKESEEPSSNKLIKTEGIYFINVSLLLKLKVIVKILPKD